MSIEEEFERVAHQSTAGNLAVRALLRLAGKEYDIKRNLQPFNSKVDFVKVLQFFDGACCYCGDSLEPKNREKDHLIPMNMTECGLHAWGNIVPSCRDCNREKHGQPWREYRTKIEKKYAKKIDAFCQEYQYDFDAANFRQVVLALHKDVGKELSKRVWQSLQQVKEGMK